ncbi:hypothetical protein HRbin39_01216 [bacterium HR39]|nr:hypothetical protein HRbin39_01216 [bacterium HR39]
MFVGASSHDVAQVEGAGSMISAVAGETATIVRLVRLSLLAPPVLGLSRAIGRFHRAKGPRVRGR